MVYYLEWSLMQKALKTDESNWDNSWRTYEEDEKITEIGRAHCGPVNETR